MYLWLSQHFSEELFVQKGKAAEMATHIANLLGQSLVQSAGRWHDKQRKQGQKKSGRFSAGKPNMRTKVIRPRRDVIHALEDLPDRVPAVC